MNSRERTEMTVEFQEPDRVPFQLMHDEAINPHVPNVYRGELNGNDSGLDLKMFEDLNYLSLKLYDMDILMIFPNLGYPQPRVSHSDGRDWLPEHLLQAFNDMDSLNWPDPSEKKVYKEFENIREKYSGKYIVGSIPGVLYYYHIFRGYQNMMFDIFDDPDNYHKLVTEITNIQEEVVRRICDYDIDAVFIGDDICGRKGLMMSPYHLEKFVWEYNQRFTNIGVKNNIPVFYHTDGATTEIFDKLVEMEVTGINPVQYHLHNLREIKRRYGKNLVFWGCIDNSYILRTGTPKEVENHVSEVFEIMGKDGGLIMSPSSISYTTPKENVDIMVDTIKNKCIYKK